MKAVNEVAVQVVTTDIDEGEGEESWFFEGTEKLLEIWFVKTSSEQSLRHIPRSELDKLMTVARCEIVSSTSNHHIDSYVLSESSLFVSDSRIILKTCGTTRLMDAVGEILRLAEKYARMPLVANMFYSRKSFQKPHLQCFKHRDFETETEHLDEFFNDGTSYCLGSLKDDLRWYLYTLQSPRAAIPGSDQTLEILMHDLDPDVMDVFTQSRSGTAAIARQKSGISKLMPDRMRVDDKLFDPCGYSLNGIMEDSDEYTTIHITPENEFSYVSLETNHDQNGFFEMTTDTLKCFRPGRFLLTVFANRESTSGRNAQNLIWNRHIDGYKQAGLQFVLLTDHTLVYAHYRRVVERSTDSGMSEESDD